MDRDKYGHLNLFSVPDLYTASKNAAFRKHILMKAEAISKVFTESKLSKDDLYKRFRENSEEFRIIINDLTDEGIEFAKTNFQKWLKNTDRWKTDHSVKKYTDTMVEQVDKYRARNS